MRFLFNSSYAIEKGETMNPNEFPERNKASKLQWFLFVVVIPIIFTITLLLVILTIAGVNVWDTVGKVGSKIPVVSSFVDDPTDVKEENEQEETDKLIVELEGTIKDYKAQIDSLEFDVNSKNEQLDGLNATIEDLTAKLAEKQETAHAQEESVKKLSDSISVMEPEAAGPIFESLEKPLAVQILHQIPTEQRGKIFEVMDPEIAADLINAFMENSSAP
jgi:flagellar protein FlbB